jgi:hypothetical protein
MRPSQANRATQFDVAKCIRTDTITYGLESSLSSGNWIIKRFRMERKGVTQVGREGARRWGEGPDETKGLHRSGTALPDWIYFDLGLAFITGKTLYSSIIVGEA